MTRRSEGKRDEGVALVLALLFIVLLTAIVVDFNYEMQVAASVVGTQSSDFEAYLAAKSAVASGMGLLATDLFANEEFAAAGDVEDVFDSYEDIWAEGIPMAPLNEAIMQCTIDDEYGKINLNALVYENESGEDLPFEPVAEMLQILFEYRGLDTTPVDAIIDWLDSDDNITDPDGQEFDYYSSLENPYGCKNGPMDSIEELLLIPGITPEMYFGNLEEGFAPLSDLLTVHGHPQGKININTAAFEVLVAYFVLVGDVSPEQSADSVQLRLEELGPYTGRSQLEGENLVQAIDPGANNRENNRNDEENDNGNGTGQPNRPGDLLDWASSTFRIRGDGQSGDAQVRVEAYVWRDTFGNGAQQTFRILDWRIYR